MIRSVDWTVWVLLVAAATLEFAGDLAMKWWAETDRWPGLIGGLVVYGLALVLFAVLLRRAELAVIFALWVGVAAALLALAGWWLFGEALSLRQLAGLALVMGGLFCWAGSRLPGAGHGLRLAERGFVVGGGEV